MQVLKKYLLPLAAAAVCIGFAACGAPAQKPVERAEVSLGDGEAAQRLFGGEKTEPTAAGAEFDGTVIVMLGDSLTAGFELPERDALPAVLEDRLTSEAFPVKVVNAGVSGDTSAGGLGRYAFSVAAHEPDIVVVALGANDVLSGGDPARTLNNLSTIIETAQADGARVLLLGLSGRSINSRDTRLSQFERIYPTLARTYDVALVPEMLRDVRGQSRLLLDDGMHPNAQGVDVMADQIEQELRRIMRGL